MKSQVYKRKGGTRNELLARILDVVASKKKHENQLGRATRDLRPRVAKCTKVEGGIFQRLL